MTSLRMLLLSAIIGLNILGCHSSAAPASTTPGGGEGTAVSGIALPSEISALPPKSATASSSTLTAAGRSNLNRIAAALVSELPTDSDYATAATAKWVNEQALSQFDILNSIFKAVGQTLYADSANVNQGPYQAMVSAVGGGSNSQSKLLELWTIDSSLVTENGQEVNEVHVWFEDINSTPARLIRVVLKVYSAPTQLADGTYSDYGVWTINAQFDDTNSRYFTAAAEQGVDGMSIVKLHEVDDSGQETAGILHKSGTSGYGKVSYPDWSQCNSDNCTPSAVTVAYAYDAHHVELQRGGVTLFKDRDDVIDLVDRYGVYDGTTGEDVSKAHRFGFPITYARDGGGAYGYYGAWQGRHQVWANGQSIPAGVTVTRADHRAGEAVESYTSSEVFTGILVKRTLQQGELSDIQGVVVQTWTFDQWSLLGDGAAWQRCDGGTTWAWDSQSNTSTQTCAGATSPVSDWSAYQSVTGGRQVYVNAWDSSTNSNVQLIYDPALPGFKDQSTGAAFAPSQGAVLYVNVNGPIWIYFDGAAWMQKQLSSIDPSTQQPTFVEGGDVAYTMPAGREYYLNSMGMNYIVKCTTSSVESCTAQVEIQSIANPLNVGTFLPSGTVFQQPWVSGPSTYRFVTDAAEAHFMKLVYASVGAQDGLAGAQAGDVVTSSVWGLSTTLDGVTVQFNWEYPGQSSCSSCGTQQFLLAQDGGFVLLDDPLRFASIALVNGAGQVRAYALQFDGNWMSGLPDLHSDLQDSGYVVTADIQAKAVAIPDGTELVDATDSAKRYVVKQLQVSEYLGVISDPGGLDPTLASAIDLTMVPTYVPTGLSVTPPIATLKYSEGNWVE